MRDDQLLVFFCYLEPRWHASQESLWFSAALFLTGCGWALNPRAYRELAPFGGTVGIPFCYWPWLWLFQAWAQTATLGMAISCVHYCHSGFWRLCECCPWPRRTRRGRYGNSWRTPLLHAATKDAGRFFLYLNNKVLIISTDFAGYGYLALYTEEVSRPYSKAIIATT